MSKPTLESLRNAFGSEQTEERVSLFANYYKFFAMKDNEHAVVRFLPDLNEDNARGFLVEKVVHQLTINGKKRTVPCLSMYGEPCPICDLSQKYYKNDDKVNGKKYWRKRQYIAQAIVVNDPLPPDPQTGETNVGKVRHLALSYQIYNAIKDAFQSPDNILESEPFNFENGYDFIIKKTPQGEHSVYSVGTRFAVRPRSLTPEEMEAAAEQMVDLSTLLPPNPGFEKVQAMLNADITGSEYGGGDEDDEDDGDSVKAASVPKPATPSVPAKTKEAPASSTVEQQAAEKPSSEAGQPADFSELMAKINARRAARQS